MKLSDLAPLLHLAHRTNNIPASRKMAGANRGTSYTQGNAPKGPNSQKMLK